MLDPIISEVSWLQSARKLHRRRTIHAVLLLGGFALIPVVFVRLTWGDGPPPRYLTDFNEWPGPLQQLVVESKVSAADIEVYDVADKWVDTHQVWRIRCRPEVIDAFAELHGLQRAAARHPKAAELLRSLPGEWPQPTDDQGTVFATPGYGITHQEAHLFLVLTNPATGRTYVLYEYVF